MDDFCDCKLFHDNKNRTHKADMQRPSSIIKAHHRLFLLSAALSPQIQIFTDRQREKGKSSGRSQIFSNNSHGSRDFLPRSEIWRRNSTFSPGIKLLQHRTRLPFILGEPSRLRNDRPLFAGISRSGATRLQKRGSFANAD